MFFCFCKNGGHIMGKDIDEAASGFGNVFRDRLTYLMNGNNVYGKPVNTQ